MPKTPLIRPRGIDLSSGRIDDRLEGRMARCEDLYLTGDGALTLRPSIETANTTFTLGTTKGVSDFGTKLVVHHGTTVTVADTSSATALSTAVTAVTDKLTEFADFEGSLFFTSSTGIRKLENTTDTDHKAAGGLICRAISSGTLAIHGTYDWLANDKAVAYRALIGYEDSRQRLVLGPPSGRRVVQNSAGGARYPSVDVLLPSGATTSHIVRLYRSKTAATAATVPGDEMFLVYEVHPTSSDVSNGYVTIADYTPEAMLGAPLYTNSQQEGILAQNDPPPLGEHLAIFGSCLWLANLTDRHTKEVQLVNSTGSSGVAIGDEIAIGGTIYVAAGAENVATPAFAVVTGGTPSDNVRQTAESLCWVVNKTTNNTTLSATYLSTPDDLPGKLLVEERSYGATGQFGCAVSAKQSAWVPQLPTLSAAVTAGNLNRTGTTVTVTLAAHGFSVGDVVLVAAYTPEARFPTGLKTVATVPGSGSFTYTETATTDGANATSYKVARMRTSSTIDNQTTAGLSSAETLPAGLSFSKDLLPEAHPRSQRIVVGSANKEINGIAATQDALFIFKEDGLFVLSGVFPNWTVAVVDPEAVLVAGGRLDVGGGAIYAALKSGLARVTQAGIEVLSKKISTAAPTSYSRVVYDRARNLVLFSGTGGTYVFHPALNAWAKWSPIALGASLALGYLVWAHTIAGTQRLGFAGDTYSADLGASQTFNVSAWTFGTLSNVSNSYRATVTLSSAKSWSAGDLFYLEDAGADVQGHAMAANSGSSSTALQLRKLDYSSVHPTSSQNVLYLLPNIQPVIEYTLQAPTGLASSLDWQTLEISLSRQSGSNTTHNGVAEIKLEWSADDGVTWVTLTGSESEAGVHDGFVVTQLGTYADLLPTAKYRSTVRVSIPRTCRYRTSLRVRITLRPYGAVQNGTTVLRDIFVNGITLEYGAQSAGAIR